MGNGIALSSPTEAPKDEKVVRFVGQAAGVVVMQTCSQLQISHLVRLWPVFNGKCMF